MTLMAGNRLGPYEIVAPLGAGGMGEVYRAKDPRLGREVAIKVLPASFSQDTDRLKRFEQEARAAGVLNHPNITAVHDLGSHEGAPYIVTELLEGETLRSRLSSGSLPIRKAIDYAIQIAKGLAAAHEKGIVHRDLKPENLFVTNDGRVKILDFGLAKLKAEKSPGEQTDMQTVSGGTQPGIVLGTMGYMSPEQVRGKAADKRSDLFSFGTILYEMLSGQRAFRGDTAADTITAILTKEPPDLAQTNKDVPPAIERIVRHCLEKNPEERFESARDVAFDLESLSTVSSPTGPVASAPPTARRRWVAPTLVAAAVALVAGLAVGYRFGKKAGYIPPPAFQELTFRRGELYSARFAPDGQTVIYSAAWEGKPVEVFATRTDRPESRVFGLMGTDVMAISKTGEMLVTLGRHVVEPFIRSGTLAEVGVSGGVAPRELLTGVHWADWAPAGKDFLVVRDQNQRNRIEYPVGNVLYQSVGWVSHPRISPDGSLVAFLDHPLRRDDGGSVAVVDRAGKKRTLAGPFSSEYGLAWSPDGREVWFTATRVGGNRALQAVTLSGDTRLIARVPQSLTLQDVASDGRALVAHDIIRIGIAGRRAGDPKDRELAWLDWSAVFDLTKDGKTILFSETGEGSGPGYLRFRPRDGRIATRSPRRGRRPGALPGRRLGGRRSPLGPRSRNTCSTRPGQARNTFFRRGTSPWSPRRPFCRTASVLVITASEPGHRTRLYLVDLPDGKPRAFTPDGYRAFSRGVSPDGKFVLAGGRMGGGTCIRSTGGEPTPIPGLEPDDTPEQWTGRKVLSTSPAGATSLPASSFWIWRRAARRPGRSSRPRTAPVSSTFAPIIATPDGASYVFGYSRTLSDLYVIEPSKVIRG